jgi:hypothetical protein
MFEDGALNLVLRNEQETDRTQKPCDFRIGGRICGPPFDPIYPNDEFSQKPAPLFKGPAASGPERRTCLTIRRSRLLVWQAPNRYNLPVHPDF